jgi:mono/diheme cytochrome c family protein
MSPNPTMPITPDAGEPQAGGQAVPVWLLVSILVLVYWGLLYFDQNGGWFSQQVYTPYRSFEEVYGMWPRSGDDGPFFKGKDLFSKNCAVCHMENGVGNPANGCTPLIKSEWVAAEGPNRLIRLVSNGGIGPIEVGGKVYEGQGMLAVGNGLPGDEKEKSESIAAILFYVRKNFAGISKPITPEQVMRVRDPIKTRATQWTPAELKMTSDTD